MTPESNLNRLRLEAYRLSELSLASDAAAADKADQRANAFSGMMLAGAALLAGLSNQTQPQVGSQVQVGLLLAALMLIIAAGLAGYSARPQSFYLPGARFDDFSADFEANTQCELALVELAGFNDKHSRHNRRILDKNSQWLGWSYRTAIVGVAIAVLSQTIVFCNETETCKSFLSLALPGDVSGTSCD